MRRTLIFFAVAAALIVALAVPAQAKVPGFHLARGMPPVAGEPVTLTLVMTDTLPEGLDMPDLVVFRLGDREVWPRFVVARGGAVMTAEVTFPVPGPWVMTPFPQVQDRVWIQVNYDDAIVVDVVPAATDASAVHRPTPRLQIMV